MSVIYVLLAISIVIAVLFFIAFIVSVKSGQYDDAYTPSVRMLFEDELVKPNRQADKPFKERTNTLKNLEAIENQSNYKETHR
jgi:cbb3-type cytochrome oxidase maturation protein